MKLIIASNNAHKVQEIEAILKDYFEEMVTMKEAGLSIDVVEDGDTFEKNAVKKAVEVLEKSGFNAALADDTGLCVGFSFCGGLWPVLHRAEPTASSGW